MALLAYIVVNGRSSRDTLATLLWPEHDQQGARNNLRRTLFKLNKTAVSQWLRTENEWIELAANGRIDLQQFQAHLEANERQQAVDLYRGDFLANFFLPNNSEFEAWSHSQRERLRQQVFGLLDSLIQDGLDRGAYKTAEKQARRQLEIDDLHEPAYRQLMLALAKRGQRRPGGTPGTSVGFGGRRYQHRCRCCRFPRRLAPRRADVRRPLPGVR